MEHGGNLADAELFGLSDENFSFQEFPRLFEIFGFTNKT